MKLSVAASCLLSLPIPTAMASTAKATKAKASPHTANASTNKIVHSQYFLGSVSCPKHCVSGATFGGILAAENVQQCNPQDKNQRWIIHQVSDGGGEVIKVESPENAGRCLGVAAHGGDDMLGDRIGWVKADAGLSGGEEYYIVRFANHGAPGLVTFEAVTEPAELPQVGIVPSGLKNKKIFLVDEARATNIKEDESGVLISLSIIDGGFRKGKTVRPGDIIVVHDEYLLPTIILIVESVKNGQPVADTMIWTFGVETPASSERNSLEDIVRAVGQSYNNQRNGGESYIEQFGPTNLHLQASNEDTCNGQLALVDCQDTTASWLFSGAELYSAECWINGHSAAMTVNEDCTSLELSLAENGAPTPITRAQSFMLLEPSFVETIVDVTPADEGGPKGSSYNTDCTFKQCTDEFGKSETLFAEGEYQGTSGYYCVCKFILVGSTKPSTACEQWAMYRGECDRGDKIIFGTYCANAGGELSNVDSKFFYSSGDPIGNYEVCTVNGAQCAKYDYYGSSGCADFPATSDR